MKTQNEIDALKKSWMKDPCWDIYSTEGFEEHSEELKMFQEEQERKWKNEAQERDDARASLVREQTGVVDADIVSALSTWNEIERMISSQDKYLGEFAFNTTVMADLQRAQIRAILLQAAQLKRIADALEKIDSGDDLVTTARILGS